MAPTPTLRQRVPLLLHPAIRTECVTFNDLPDAGEHVALCFAGEKLHPVPLVRLHSACLTGDVFGSRHCDCGAQLQRSIRLLDEQGGVLLYMAQEGRGIGLYNKIDTYHLQRTLGLDTFAANRHAGFPDDARDFSSAAAMLMALGVSRVRLLTNNPHKIDALAALGIDVVEWQPMGTYVTPENENYLTAKKEQHQHRLTVARSKG